MPKKIIKISLALMAIFLILYAMGTFSHNAENTYNLSYLEDKSGEMSLEEVEKASTFQAGHKNGLFSFGNSSSKFWIKIPLSDFKKGEEYISVYNPTVKDVALYLPTRDGSVKVLKSGWSASDKQDEGMLYPVFRLDEDTDYGSNAYLQVYSDFTQSYTLDFLTEKESNADRAYAFLLQGILFGIMLSVAVQVFLTFLQLKEKSYLYYFLYMVLFIIYQGCLSGIYNIISPLLARYMMPFTITLSLISINAMILFSMTFFNMENTMPACRKIVLGFIYANFIVAIVSLFMPIVTNLYAHLFSVLYAAFFIYIAYRALKKGSKIAKIYIVGMSVVIFSLLASVLRNAALINNNVFTLNIVSIASVIQSVLIFSLLIKLVKTLTEEKTKLATNYKLAEEKAYRAEVAYLRTQIRPHFLYNALNATMALCDIDASAARESLLDLSDFLRHTYDFDDNREVFPIKKELEFVKAYVRIEKMRFKDKWDISYNVDNNISVLIPPLILQPLVENAIIHGVNKKKSYGHITLTIKEKDTYYLFEVKDDGRGMDEVTIKEVGKRSGHVGISNIDKRLQRHYKEHLHIKSELGAGTTVYFKIPKGNNAVKVL